MADHIRGVLGSGPERWTLGLDENSEGGEGFAEEYNEIHYFVASLLLSFVHMLRGAWKRVVTDIPRW